MLVPGEFATGHHQAKNAAYFEHGGGAGLLGQTVLERLRAANGGTIARTLLARIHRLTLGRLRREIEPVESATLDAPIVRFDRSPLRP